MFVYYNPNPLGARVGDCTVRAVSKALDTTWGNAYIELVIQGYMLCDMPSANHVVGRLLKENGFNKYVVDDDEEHECTVKDFCKNNPKGTFVLGVENHVICAKDGNYFDSFDSGSEVVLYFWKRG